MMQPPNIDVWAFLVGSFSAFAMKFLIAYKKRLANFRKKKKTDKLMILYNIIYILLGGIFTMILNPINVVQAIIFGGAWESIFVNLIVNEKKMEVKK